MPRRPPKAAKAATKGKTAPAKVRRLGGSPAANAATSSWEEETRARLVKTKTDATPEQIETMLQRMTAIRAEAEANHRKRKPAGKEARETAQAECDKAIAAATKKPPPTEGHRLRSTGRRAAAALTVADAGFDLAKDIAADDGHLQISLEALGLWLAGLVDTQSGEQVARWRLVPEECFTASRRKAFTRWRDPKRKRPRSVVRNAQELKLKSEGRKWLWQEFARTAEQDGETDAAKALGHLIGWHKEAAERFVERFLAARHSTQDEVKTRLYKTATALASGDMDSIRETRKEDRDRIFREHPKRP